MTVPKPMLKSEVTRRGAMALDGIAVTALRKGGKAWPCR